MNIFEYLKERKRLNILNKELNSCNNRIKELTDKITIDKNKIPSEFFYDFLRGYFDGDGSFVLSSRLKNNGERPLTGVKFTGSKNIIHSLFDILSEEYKCTLYEDNRNSKNNCWYLGLYGESGRKLLKNLYHKSTISLDRKYEKYLEYFA